MRFLLDKDCLEPSLEHMSRSFVLAIESLGVDAVEQLHAPGEIGRRCLNEKMIVVGHQAVRVARPSISGHNLAKGFDKQTSIIVGDENVCARIAPAGDVVDSTLVFDSKWASHGESV